MSFSALNWLNLLEGCFWEKKKPVNPVEEDKKEKELEVHNYNDGIADNPSFFNESKN